jgi:AAHS family 4-hydroxybenzoate transporter-like MFS transporter
MKIPVNGAAAADSSSARYGRPYRILAIGFFIVMVDGYDTMMISFLAPLLTARLKLTPMDLGALFAVGYIGAILGAIAAGSLADRFGRKPLLIASLGIASAATLMCAAASSGSVLTGLRFLAGVGLGGTLPALVSLVAEKIEPSRRHGTITLMYLGFPIGAVVGGAVTAALLRHGSGPIFAGAGSASAAALAAACWLPESLHRRPGSQAPSMERRTVFSSIREQFAERRLWPGLMLWLGLFSLLVVTHFLVSWTPSILSRSGLSPAKAALGGVLLNLGGALTSIVSAPLINRFGPYLPSTIAVGCGAAAIAFVGQSSLSGAEMMAALFVIGACIIGGQLNFPAMTVALYPAHVRGAGTGWTMGVGRIGSIVGPVTGGALIAANLPTGKLFLIAALPAIVAAVALAAAARIQRSRSEREA